VPIEVSLLKEDKYSKRVGQDTNLLTRHALSGRIYFRRSHNTPRACLPTYYFIMALVPDLLFYNSSGTNFDQGPVRGEYLRG